MQNRDDDNDAPTQDQQRPFHGCKPCVIRFVLATVSQLFVLDADLQNAPLNQATHSSAAPGEDRREFAGPCRLGYYDELKDSILRDLGYEFDMLNFATVTGKPLKEYIEVCKRKINPNVSVPHGASTCWQLSRWLNALDEANDYYSANAAFLPEISNMRRADMTSLKAGLRAPQTRQSCSRRAGRRIFHRRRRIKQSGRRKEASAWALSCTACSI